MKRSLRNVQIVYVTVLGDYKIKIFKNFSSFFSCQNYYVIPKIKVLLPRLFSFLSTVHTR